MTKLFKPSSVAKPKKAASQQQSRWTLSLFWRLFLSLLFTLLLTAVLSIFIERYLNEQALTTLTDRQIERLMERRAPLIAALQTGDTPTVTQMYQDERRLMSQIRVYDADGGIVYPRYRDMFETRSPKVEPPEANVNDRIGGLSSFILDTVRPPSNHKPPDFSQRAELLDTRVQLPDGQYVTVQLRPHLSFKDIMALQNTNLAVRISLILLLSVLMCLLLSRTMTRRIRQVQHSVQRMMMGDYQNSEQRDETADDELGRLAYDVSELSKRLADSELARKQVLSDISHELRSPLARLEIATELARDCAPSAERYLLRIDKETARMNELIEHIIRIQSLQMRKYTLDNGEYELVDLSSLLTEIGQDVCFEFQNKGVFWQWQAPTNDDSWQVQGNPEQLRSAFENIIRNAFMHTPAGGTVTALLDKPNTQQLRVRIIDEGGGIADADTQRIFQPFVRLDSARHRQTGGYGLGLAIVHAVISAHQGQVEARNCPKDEACQSSNHAKGLMVQVVLPL